MSRQSNDKQEEKFLLKPQNNSNPCLPTHNRKKRKTISHDPNADPGKRKHRQFFYLQRFGITQRIRALRRGLVVKTFLPEVRTLIKRRFLPVISSPVYGAERDQSVISEAATGRFSLLDGVISTRLLYFYTYLRGCIARPFRSSVYRGNFWQTGRRDRPRTWLSVHSEPIVFSRGCPPRRSSRLEATRFVVSKEKKV